MDSLSYESIYLCMLQVATFKVHGVFLCRILAPFVSIAIFMVSRLVSSIIVKFVAFAAGFIVYCLPDVVSVFIR